MKRVMFSIMVILSSVLMNGPPVKAQQMNLVTIHQDNVLYESNNEIRIDKENDVITCVLEENKLPQEYYICYDAEFSGCTAFFFDQFGICNRQEIVFPTFYAVIQVVPASQYKNVGRLTNGDYLYSFTDNLPRGKL